MESTEKKPEEKHKYGGWGVFIGIIAVVVGLMLFLKFVLQW